MESTISRLRHTRVLARFNQNLVFYDNWHFGIKRKTLRENLTVAFLFLTGIDHKLTQYLFKSQPPWVYTFMSCVMRKPALFRCGNKGEHMLPGNHTASQCLCFHFIDRKSFYFLNPTFQPFPFSCVCTARFVLDPVETPTTDFLIRIWDL